MSFWIRCGLLVVTAAVATGWPSCYYQNQLPRSFQVNQYVKLVPEVTGKSSCWQTCRLSNSRYYGIRRNASRSDEVQCYCGDNVNGTTYARCNYICEGNNQCGGNRYSFYYITLDQVCPPGSYGDRCTERCGHCRGSSGCSPLDGACYEGCITGWAGSQCVGDVNECTESTSSPCVDLAHVCTNTQGSYSCHVCASGLRPSAYRTHCIDVDECLDKSNNLCGDVEVCTNTEGSYTCTCAPGYVLMADSANCEDINECIQSSGNPCTNQAHVCSNTQGHYTCDVCHSGFKPSPDRTLCIATTSVSSVAPAHVSLSADTAVDWAEISTHEGDVRTATTSYYGDNYVTSQDGSSSGVNLKLVATILGTVIAVLVVVVIIWATVTFNKNRKKRQDVPDMYLITHPNAIAGYENIQQIHSEHRKSHDTEVYAMIDDTKIPEQCPVRESPGFQAADSNLLGPLPETPIDDQSCADQSQATVCSDEYLTPCDVGSKSTENYLAPSDLVTPNKYMAPLREQVASSNEYVRMDGKMTMPRPYDISKQT